MATKRKRCERGHLLSRGNIRVDAEGRRHCKSCERIRAKERYAANPEPYTNVCPGCRKTFTTKSSQRKICPDCTSDPAKREKARRARERDLEAERDAEMIRKLEQEKPTRYIGPITAESIISKWGRG